MSRTDETEQLLKVLTKISGQLEKIAVESEKIRTKMAAK